MTNGTMSGAVRHLSRAGWAAAAVLVLLAACGSSSDDEPDTSSLPPCPETATVDPHGMRGHEGDDHPAADVSDEPSRDCRLPTAVQAELDPQLAVTRDLLEEYPDATAAQTGGYALTEGNSHLVNWAYMDDEFDLAHPEMLLLDDAGDTDEVVAAVYYVVTDDAAPPEGFVGTRDQWHPHTDVCAVPARTGDDGAQVSCDDDEPEGCEIALLRSGPDGECDPTASAEGADGWMLHVWEAPGHTSPLGLFSAD